MANNNNGSIKADVDVSVTEASLKSLDDYIKKFEEGILKIQKISARTWEATLEYTDKAGKKITTSTKLNKTQALKLSTKTSFNSSRGFLLDAENSARERKNKMALQRNQKKEQEAIKEEERLQKEKAKAEKEEAKQKERQQREEDRERRRQEAERIKELKAQEKQQALEEKDILKAEQEKLKYERGQQFLGLVASTLDPYEALRVNIQIKQNELLNLKKHFSEVGEEGSEEFERIKQKIIETQKELNELNKEFNKGRKISQLEKLFNTIKRVGFYRIARNLFRFVEAGLGEGLKGLTLTSSGANKTLSSIVTNVQKLANSLTMVIYPALELIEPILTVITNVVGKLAEGISYLAFNLGLTSSWFKINSDYAKEFNNEMNKFSFDKFESMSSNDPNNTSGMFTEMFNDDATKSIKAIADTLKLIGEMLLVWGTYKFFTWIYDKGVSLLSKDLEHAFDTLDSGATKSKNAFQKMYDKINPVYLAILGISLAIDGITDALNWDETTSGLTKTLDILKIVFGVVAGIAGIVASFSKGGVAKIAKAVAFSATLAGVVTTVTEKITGYAEGGLPEKGSMFVAGEAGAEFVTTMPGGQTGVTNIAQFKQAMLEALYAWWESAKFDLPDGGSFYLDGADIANSKRFISAMNRKNSGLNLK